MLTTDPQVKQAVEKELRLAAPVSTEEIEVQVTDHIVLLTGETGNLLARQMAGQVALTVKGVTGVVNQISVAPAASITDAQVVERIRDRLKTNPATENWQIDVDVQGGTVMLQGFVDSYQEKELAGKLAMSVKGVQKLENDLKFDYDEVRPDEEIAAEVKQSLRWDIRVDHALIDVSVDNNKVKLSGKTGSGMERMLAIGNAWVNGVDNVDADELQVDATVPRQQLRDNKYVQPDDNEIGSAVSTALLLDPRLKNQDIDVQVESGKVVISGAVPSLKAHRKIESIASNIVGVSAVRNLTEVSSGSGYEQNPRLSGKIYEVIAADPYLDNSEVKVEAYGGIVFLSGQVDTYYQVMRADDLVSDLKGVKQIKNNLQIDKSFSVGQYGPYNWYPYKDEGVTNEKRKITTDNELAEEVQYQLWWSPYVQEDNIEISVDNGMVLLEGTVQSRNEEQYAIINAWEAGARQVRSQLEIDVDMEQND